MFYPRYGAGLGEALRAMPRAILALMVVAGLLILAYESLREYNRVKGHGPSAVRQTANMMRITSPAFEHGETVPIKYTCDAENVSPELRIEDVIERAKSLALIVDDPDAPFGTFTHWTVWNIDPKTAVIPEAAKGIGVEGKNDFGKNGYGGCCPPTGKTHRYFFTLYALDAMLDVPGGADRSVLEPEITKHTLERVEYMGRYAR